MISLLLKSNKQKQQAFQLSRKKTSFGLSGNKQGTKKKEAVSKTFKGIFFNLVTDDF